MVGLGQGQRCRHVCCPPKPHARHRPWPAHAGQPARQHSSAAPAALLTSRAPRKLSGLDAASARGGHSVSTSASARESPPQPGWPPACAPPRAAAASASSPHATEQPAPLLGLQSSRQASSSSVRSEEEAASPPLARRSFLPASSSSGGTSVRSVSAGVRAGERQLAGYGHGHSEHGPC